MRLRSVVLLTTLAALTCAGPVLAATESQPTRSYSFRSFANTEADEAKSVSDERGFDFTTKLKGLLGALKPSQEQTVNKLFNQFKVGTISSNVFESIEYKKWAAAVAKASMKNPEAAEVLMVSKLTTRYGDEALTKMIIASKEASSLSAGKLEAAQLTNWVVKGKSADDVFKLLNLDTKGGDAIASPVFKTWMSYVSKLNQKNPDDYRAIDVLRKHTNEVDLARYFASVGKSNSDGMLVKEYAKNLQTMLFKRWKEVDAMTPNRVASMVTLEKDSMNAKVILNYADFYKLS